MLRAIEMTSRGLLRGICERFMEGIIDLGLEKCMGIFLTDRVMLGRRKEE